MIQLNNSILGYPIFTDWILWVSLPKVFDEPNRIKRIKNLMRKVFIKHQPFDLGQAEHEILNFYAEPYAKIKPLDGEKGKSVVCFEYDRELIASAFMSDYGIDLWEQSFHYHKFCALFQNLRQENKIKQIMQWRGTELHTIENIKERRFIQEMQLMYALPLSKEEIAEKENNQAAYEYLLSRQKAK